jgi:Flp pilus assembly protein TadB
MISTSAFVVLTQLCIIFAGDGADVDVIVAAVLLPLTVLLVSILLFTTCLCVCCSTRSKQSYSVQKEEFSESVEAKHVTSTDV